MKLAVQFDLTRSIDISVLKGAREWSKQRPEMSITGMILSSKSGRRDYRSYDAMISHDTGTLSDADLHQLPAERIGYWFPSDARSHAPCIRYAHESAGAMAAAYLKQIGLTAFGYVHDLSRKHSFKRFDGFSRYLDGDPVHEYREGHRTRSLGWSLKNQIADIAEWLLALPHPVGIFTLNEIHADRVMQAAAQADLPIPDAVSLICVSSNPLFCQHAEVPLTHVYFSPTRLGYVLAELMWERHHGLTTDTERTLEPEGVISRSSTQIHYSQDWLITKAVTWLKQQDIPEWKVASLADSLGVSSVTLRKRFHSSTGMSPKQFMRSLQVKETLRHLLDTEDELADIAYRCGFSDLAHMNRVMKQAYGQPPLELRRRGVPTA